MADREPTGSGTGPLATPATVMVVEDDDGVRDLVRRLLSRAGYRVIAFSSGEGAVAVGTDLRAPLELVVTDCRMPGMSGVAVVAHLTALRPGLPVGDADPEIVESLGARLAPTRFLGKPFTPGDLLACVRALLVGRE